MNNIVINAILKAKEGKSEQLKDTLLKVIEPSRNEAGCIEYTLHTSLDDNNIFVFYEIWNDDEALQQHLQSPHYQAYRNSAGKLLESRDVYRLNKM